MTRVVIDASLAVKWVFIEEHHFEALALLERWKTVGTNCVVPSWFACEFGNVVFRRVRGQLMTIDEARIALARVLELVAPQEFEPEVSLRALEIAHAFRLAASYDSHYLALAEHLDCDLWTADAKFRRAVGDQFPRVRWIGEIT